MKEVVIYGAGSVGRLSEQIIYDINKEKKQFILLGYLDDDAEKHGTFINDIKVLGGLDWLTNRPDVNIALGFTNPLQKHNLVKRLKNNGCDKFVKLIHPKSWISRRVCIGEGSVIYPGVHIDVDVKIGNFVLINKLCSIGHDTEIGDYSTISPGVNIGGNNNINEGVDFGINSCSIQKLNIGKWSTIGAGAVVIRDVPDKVVLVGNPGKIIRYND